LRTNTYVRVIGSTTLVPELAAHCAALVTCALCPRLVRHRESIGDESYWGRPVPGFGDPQATLLVLGLAPGAHGANRTGRPFTGDAAGILLYRTLHALGLATASESVSRDDALRLKKVWITNAVRCVPPANKPDAGESARCAPWLSRELAVLGKVRVVVALGRTAHEALLTHVHAEHSLRKKDFAFRHGARHVLPNGLQLFDCFHTSRYNVNTGRVDEPMVRAVFTAAVTAAGLPVAKG
jgi:uracil-DNA glycosylase family 4